MMADVNWDWNMNTQQNTNSCEKEQPPTTTHSESSSFAPSPSNQQSTPDMEPAMSSSNNATMPAKIFPTLPLRHIVPRETWPRPYLSTSRDRSRPLVIDHADLHIAALSHVEVIEAGDNRLGLFAKQDIPAGSIILSEAPLVVIPHTITDMILPHDERQRATFKGGDMDPLDTVIRDLSSEKKARYYNLPFHEGDSREIDDRAIVWSNGFEVLDGKAMAIFDMSCRINHSYLPNSEFLWYSTMETVSTQAIHDCNHHGKDIGRLVVSNTVSLMEGEEITIGYGHSIRRVECGCRYCTDGSESTEPSPLDKGDKDDGADNWDGSTTKANTTSERDEDSLPDTEVYDGQQDDNTTERDDTDGSATEESTLPDTASCHCEKEDGDGDGDGDDGDGYDSDGYHTDEEPEPNSVKPTNTGNTSFESRRPVRDNYPTNSVSPISTPSSTATSNGSITSPVTPAPPVPPPYMAPLGKLLEVRTSTQAGKHRGLGVFAISDFPRQTILILEKPLLTLQYPLNSARACAHVNSDPIDALVDNLPDEQRIAFRALHQFSSSSSSPKTPNREILGTNGFEIGETGSGPGSATGVFKTICRINHSYRPNSKCSWKQDLGCMMVQTVREVAKGEEITIDYGWYPEKLTKYFGLQQERTGV